MSCPGKCVNGCAVSLFFIIIISWKENSPDFNFDFHFSLRGNGFVLIVLEEEDKNQHMKKYEVVTQKLKKKHELLAL